MKFKREHFCCRPTLLSIIPEISEIEEAIANVAWTGQFRLKADDKSYEHQTGYHKLWLSSFISENGSFSQLRQMCGFA